MHQYHTNMRECKKCGFLQANCLHLWQVAFTGNYDEYFGYSTDVDAVVYLMLVNDMIHGLYPEAIVVGEDVSQLCFCSVTLKYLSYLSSIFSINFITG